jgi:steroid delta-isomerase-like uncharacterized protein
VSTDELIQRYNDAWNQRDFAIFGEIFAEGVTYWDPFVDQQLGAEAMGGYAQQLLAAFPDLRFEATLVRSAEDFGVFEWVMRGRNSGTSSLHPATNHELALPGIDLITVENARIRTIKAFFDVGQYARQLGLPAVAAPTLS